MCVCVLGHLIAKALITHGLATSFCECIYLSVHSLLRTTFVVIALTSAASLLADIYHPLSDFPHSLLYCSVHVRLSTVALLRLPSHLHDVSALEFFYAVVCLLCSLCDNFEHENECEKWK